MQQKLVGEIKITPAEVRRYFKDLPQDSIPYIPTQVEVQIITQQPKVPLEEIEDVKSVCVSIPTVSIRAKAFPCWLVCTPRTVARPCVAVK